MGESRGDDRSKSLPKRMHTVRNDAPQAILVEWRKALLLPLDDLLPVTQEVIGDTTTLSAL